MLALIVLREPNTFLDAMKAFGIATRFAGRKLHTNLTLSVLLRPTIRKAMVGLRSNFVLMIIKKFACSSVERRRTLLRSRTGVVATAKQSYKQNMHIVYILRSIPYPDRLYIGLTTNLDRRLETHNAGSSTYSKRYSPWELETYVVLKDKKIAEDLEKYLKSGSGFAFLKKRLLPRA